MQIEWKSETGPPYLIRQVEEWTGVHVHRARFVPGRMLEYTPNFHEISGPLPGIFRRRSKCVGNYFLCVPVKAVAAPSPR